MAAAPDALLGALQRGIPVGLLEEAAHAREARHLVALPVGRITPQEGDLDANFQLLQQMLRCSPQKAPLASQLTAAWLALDDVWGGSLSKAKGPRRVAWAAMHTDVLRTMLMHIFMLVRPPGRGYRTGGSACSGLHPGGLEECARWGVGWRSALGRGLGGAGRVWCRKSGGRSDSRSESVAQLKALCRNTAARKASVAFVNKAPRGAFAWWCWLLSPILRGGWRGGAPPAPCPAKQGEEDSETPEHSAASKAWRMLSLLPPLRSPIPPPSLPHPAWPSPFPS